MEVDKVNKLYDMNAKLVQTMGANNPDVPNILARGGEIPEEDRAMVSEKISVLVSEGYPQKQAVAIALDMQRRGKFADGGGVASETNAKISLNIDDYNNPYELNKGIEKWIKDNVGSFSDVYSREYSLEEKLFIKNYTGYGGLGKYGKLSIGHLFEFFTPKKVIEKMWALAYKHGYKGEHSVLEPSVGTGEFLAYSNPEARCVAYEINEYSAIITKILYPFCDVKLAPFESVFIDKRNTIRGKVDKLEKFDIVIGNCPYGSFDALDVEANTNAARLLLGFGEKDFTDARNYVEYFLRRGMDLLKPGGLMVMIIGAELKNGGGMFLDGGITPVKKYLNDNCKLLEAYRLPDTTFERTGVTSDIIVLKKNGGEKEEDRFIESVAESKTIETPEPKTEEINNGQRNKLFLSKLTDEDSDLLLTAVAKHYGKENDADYKREMYEELVDDEAEDIMDYLEGEVRKYFYPMWKRINQVD
jgi:hypothetical protein